MKLKSYINSGTLITMENGDQKPIESLKEGDKVQTYITSEDFDMAHIGQNEQEVCTIADVIEAEVDAKAIVKLNFEDDTSLIMTEEQPIYGASEEFGWLVSNVEAMEVAYGRLNRDEEDGGALSAELEVGSTVHQDDGDTVADIKVKSIEKVEGTHTMYCLDITEENASFVFANNILICAGTF
jgi:hypothetical protein